MKETKHPMTVSARLTRLWQRHGWLVIGILWLAAIALGLIGFWLHAQSTGRPAQPFDLVYRTLQLIAMGSGDVEDINPALQVARFLIPFLAAFTAVRALLSLFRDRWQHILVGLWRDHVVICGLSRKGWLLAQGFSARGKRVVVIEADESHDLIGPCRERGIVVLLGDATDTDLLERAGVVRASYVVAVTDDDGINAEISLRCQGLLRTRRRTRPNSLTCKIHLVDPELYELARTRELMLEAGAPLRLELFNVFNRGAALLWRKYGPPEESRPSLVEDTSPTSCSMHVAVIGLGRLGESLVVTAARDWHTRLHESPCRAAGRLRVTVVDEDAERKCQALAQRYPQLPIVCDLSPRTMDVVWPEFYSGEFLAGRDGGTNLEGQNFPAVSAVFVCFDDDSLGLRTGLAVQQQLLKRGASGTPVVVRMAESTGLARLIDPDGDDTGDTCANLHVFPLLDRTCTPEALMGGTHEVLARGLHEVYVQQQQALGHTVKTNPASVEWDALSPALRESNAAEVQDLLHHLADLGYGVVPLTDWDAAAFVFPVDDLARLAEWEHERWVVERKARGWAYTTGAKNISKKRSPALVPWDQLADDERKKAVDAVRELPRTLARTGFQIVRLGDRQLDAGAGPSVARHEDAGARASGAGAREVLARAIHERYRQNQHGIKADDDPAMKPWDALPEDLRESNRRMADGLESALRAAGYGVRSAVSAVRAPVLFTAGEVEKMALVVHQLWVDERIDDGWTPGPRDVAKRSTPYLVPYDELPHDVKEKDRQLVRAIPEVFAAAGLETYCLSQAA